MYFLGSVILNESYKSIQIEGIQLSQDKMYYLKYLNKTDENIEIQNIKNTIEYAHKEIYKQGKITVNLVNQMHKILLDGVDDTKKSPGNIRTLQNWIGPRGIGIKEAVFIPPTPIVVIDLLTDLYEYMNDAYIDPLLINVAISHAQFETIHPYNGSNGSLGRALIPVQMAYLDENKPILYLSEVIELYKKAYQRNLMESRRGNIDRFIKFFLQCVIDQCDIYINKLKRIKEIYIEDMKKIETVRDKSVYKIMSVIMDQVVFTKKEVQDESGLSINTVSNVINNLIDIGIIVKDSSVIKDCYRYESIYNLFAASK